MKRRTSFAVLCVLALVVGAVLVIRGGTGRQDVKAIKGISRTGHSGVTRSVAYLQSHRVRVSPASLPEPSAESVGGGPPAAGAQRVGGVDIREKPEPRETGFPPRRPHAAAPQQRVGQAAITPQSSLSSSTSFLGADSTVSGFVPPDSMGAVGPSQVLVSLNGRIRVFDKQGNLGGLNLTDSQFWSTLLPTPSIQPTDPGVEYDRLSGHWIVSAVDVENKNNLVMLAVSSGPTITDKTSFTFFSFRESLGGAQNFADYPQLGVDNNAIYIGVNLFTTSTGSFAGTEAYVIQKSSVLGAGPIHVTGFQLVGAGSGMLSPQPATDMDSTVSSGYIVGPDVSLNTIDVRRVNNPGSASPTMSSDLQVTVPTTAKPLSVPAQGTPAGLDALDDRLFEAMIARGPDGSDSLWTAHNILVNSSGVGSPSGDRDGSRWYQLGTLDTTPSLLQSGTLFDPAASNPQWYWIPSIAMNGQGHASLNTSVAGPGRFAQIAASGRLATDPAGTTETPDIVQTSTSTYNLGGGSPKRWGDYSQTVVDPTDNQTFWTFQEYASAANVWGLRVIKLLAPPPANPSSASPSSVPAGQCSASVDVTGTSAAGSGFFDPGAGFPSRISASVTGNINVNRVIYTDPTHVTLDLDTRTASLGPQDVTITNPDGQSVTATGLVDVVSSGTTPTPPCLNGTTPASPANNTNPKVFGSAEAGTTVNLYIDSGCTDPPVASDTAANFAVPGIQVSVGADSITHFYAKATDGVNTSACSSVLSGASSSVTYVEDSTPPSVGIDSGPNGLTSDTTPTFTFHGTDANPPVTFQCSIDTGTPSFGACSGPGNSDTPGIALADGPYTFRVQGTDAAGNSGGATRSFTVQAPPTPPSGGGSSGGSTATPKNPPDTSFTKAPKKTRKRRPKFKFTASEPGTSFRCQLDGGSFSPCTSPFKPPKLSLGRHVLRVEAVDSSGTADPSPAVKKFKILP